MFDEMNCTFQDATGYSWVVTATTENLAVLKAMKIDFQDHPERFLGSDVSIRIQFEIIWAMLAHEATAQGMNRLDLAHRLDVQSIRRGVEACGWAVLELDNFVPGQRESVAQGFFRVVQCARQLESIERSQS